MPQKAAFRQDRGLGLVEGVQCRWLKKISCSVFQVTGKDFRLICAAFVAFFFIMHVCKDYFGCVDTNTENCSLYTRHLACTYILDEEDI